MKHGITECHCGSGEYAQARYDARGIFLTYACEACVQEKLSHYRPEVLTDPGYEHDEPLDEE
jgi:hypothetical protein